MRPRFGLPRRYRGCGVPTCSEHVEIDLLPLSLSVLSPFIRRLRIRWLLVFSNRNLLLAAVAALALLVSVAAPSASANSQFRDTPELTVTNASSGDADTFSTTVSWETASPGLGIVLAGPSNAYLSATAGTPLTTHHAVTIDDLDCDTVVMLQTVTFFWSGVGAWGTPIEHRTPPCAAAPVKDLSVQGPEVLQRDRDRLVIGWATSHDSRGSVLFGPTSAYLLEAPSPMRGDDHFAELLDLDCGTTYHYAVIASMSDDTSTSSGDFTATTSPCSTPVVTSIDVRVEGTMAAVEFITADPSSAEIIHGSTLAYGSATLLDGPATTHRFELHQLDCGQTHHLRALLTAETGVETLTRDIQFTSGPCMDGSTAERQPLRIMALGDSITTGYGQSSNWRAFVHEDLSAVGFDVDMVGSQAGPVWGQIPEFPTDPHHEAYVSFTARRLLGLLHESVHDHRPDVALIMIGTNDVVHGRTLQETEADLIEIVRTLRGPNPEVSIVISTVIRCAEWRCGDTVHSIDDLNIAIRRLADTLDTTTSRVVLADAARTFDIDQYSDDGIHPDLDGNRILADAWMAALRTLPEFQVQTPIENGHAQ